MDDMLATRNASVGTAIDERACLSICLPTHQTHPDQLRMRLNKSRWEISRHPSRGREEAVVIRTDSNADSNPSRHERHDLDHLAHPHAQAGRQRMP